MFSSRPLSLFPLARRLAFPSASGTPLVAALVIALCGCGSGPDEKSASVSRESRAAAAPAPAFYAIRGKVDLADGQEAPTGALVFCAGTSYCAWANREGDFTISGVPAGTYALAAYRPGYKLVEVGEIEIDPEELDKEKREYVVSRVIELERDASLAPAASASGVGVLSGKVQLSDLSPPNAVRVAISDPPMSTATDRNGEFFFANLRAGEYELVFAHPGYESVTVTASVVPNQVTRLTDPVELHLLGEADVGASILGRLLLLDTAGRSLETVQGASVGVVETQQTTDVASDGSFSFQGLASGVYTLIAEAPGFALQQEVQATVTDEPAIAVLVLREAPPEPSQTRGVLTGAIRLEDRPPGAAVGVLVALAGTSHTGVTGPWGRFTLSDVVPGTHGLLASLAGYQSLEVASIEIVAGETTDIGELVMEREIIPPRVLFTTPRDDERGVKIEETVVLTMGFNKKMQIQTVQAALSVEPPCLYSVRRSPTVVESGLETRDIIEIVIQNLDPRNALRFHTQYRVSLNIIARDVEGNPLEEPFEFRFRTGGLRVLEVRPPEGATNVQAQFPEPVLVRFNGVVDESTLNERNVSVSPAPYARRDTKDIASDPKTGWTVVQMWWTWNHDTAYTVNLGSGIRTPDGTSLEQAPYRVSFRTVKAPQLEPTPQ
jgi:hypothetical protein